MGFIYTLVDPITDMDVYVGCTTRPIEIRRRHHSTNIEKTPKGNWVSEIKSKGLDIKIKVLDEVPNKDLSFWEIHYISLFKSWGIKLLNSTNGGVGIPNEDGSCKKKIIQYTMEGDFVKVWNSVREASLSLGLDSHAAVSSCARGKIKYAHGYIWRFHADDFPKKINSFYENYIQDGKTIYQYTLDGKFIKEWPSVKSASLHVCGKISSPISEVLAGRQHSSYGYIWSETKIPEGTIIKVKYPSNKRPVNQYDLNDNFIQRFNSISDANFSILGKILGCCISDAVRGRQKTAYGYKWKYAD